MTRRLLVGLAAVLLVGAVLDGTVQRSHGVYETLGQERPFWLVADESTRLEQPTLVGTAERGRPDGGRFGLYVALRDVAPGVTIHVDERISRQALPVAHLVGIGGARVGGSVRTDGVTVPDRTPERTGTYRGGSPWAMHLADEDPEVLLALPVRGGVVLVDVRLLDAATRTSLEPSRDEVAGPVRSWARPRDAAPSLVRGASGEAGVLVGLLVLGGLLVPWGRARIERAALALISGVALHGALGMLLLPGLWGPTVTVMTALALGAFARRRGLPVGWRRDDLPLLAGTSVLIVGVVVLVRATGALLLTGDSHHYWGGGAALADGTFGAAALDVKRGISQQALHALGFLAGAEGLQALNAVLLVAGGVLVAAVATRWAPATPVAALVLAALVASPQVRAITAFLSGHLVVGVLLVGLVVLLRDTDDAIAADAAHRVRAAIAILIAALVVTRPEGGALVALVLLGASLGRRDSAGRARARVVAAWSSLGVASLLWGCALTIGAMRFDGERAIAIDLLLLIGLAALVAARVNRVTTTRAWRTVVLAGGAALWAVTLALLSRDRVRFIDAAVENVGRGEGGWGVLGPLLLIAALVAVTLTSGSTSADVQAARWLIIGFVPVALLAKLGDGLQVPEEGLERLLSGGGRIGWGDSVNRMWMHAVLVVGYLLVRAAQQRDRANVAFVPLLALAVLGPWFAFQWQPSHVPIRSELREVRVLDAFGSEVLVDLVDGAVVEQTSSLDLTRLRGDAVLRSVCVDVPLVTFGRQVSGRILIDVEQGSRGSTLVLPADRIVDWNPNRACLDLDEPVVELDRQLDLRVRLTSEGAAVGSAPGALRANTARGFGALVTVPGDDGPRTVRAENLSLTVLAVVEEPVGLFDRPLERATLVLPWLGLLLGGGAVRSRLRGAGRAGVR